MMSAVLRVAIMTLAAGPSPPGAGAAPVTVLLPGAAISTCFAPEQDCAAFAVQAIDRARRQILVSAYNLTTGAGIVEALLRARARGVDVRLIADKRTPCERNTGIDPLAAAGTPIWIDRTVPIAHAKIMVIDSIATLMGSYNWTRNAARNSEDLNLVASRAVAAIYAAQWRNRVAVSVPFAGREDWCRPRAAIRWTPAIEPATLSLRPRRRGKSRKGAGMFDLIVSGGLAALPGSAEPADIGVAGGKIAAIGAPGSLAACRGGTHRRRRRARSSSPAGSTRTSIAARRFRFPAATRTC